MDQVYLKERLSYDPSTGVFTWNKCEKMPNNWNARFAGEKAGNVDCPKDGYVRIRIGIDGVLYRAHQLAWFYMTGKWPAGEIDHIDHDGVNNIWGNLREVTHGENSKNRSKKRNNTSGVTGVCWYKPLSKWCAYITASGKRVNGGYFKDITDAATRRKELEIEYGFHPNHGI